MKRNINVVKIGGNVVDNPEALNDFLCQFAKMDGPKILVHGGGREATRLSAALGIETTMIEGRRVTDAATLEVVTMVYAGLINKRIVAKLQAFDCDAIGLSGADADVISAVKRKSEPVDYGYVGDISNDGVSENVIAMMLRNNLTPVFCAIIHDGNGELLNCNADTVAAAVAVSSSRLYPVTLTYCFEKPGVLADAEDETSLIPVIDSENIESLKADGTLSGGMIPKVDNAFAAVKKGVKRVVIKSALQLCDESAGTTIRL
mgnify:CR=1 FL=1